MDAWESFARELEGRLVASGWVRTDDEDLELARPLADGLELGLDVFEDEDGTIAADIEVSHPRAGRWLLAEHKPIPVSLVWELGEAAGRDEPLAWDGADLAAAAAHVATLAGEAAAALAAKAGTRASFVAALREHPDRAAQLDDILAALDHDGEPPPRERPAAPTFAAARARVEAERAALAAVEARRLPDTDDRAAALAAELQARGIERSPLWIRRKVEATPPQTWGGFLKDVVNLGRSIRDREHADLPHTYGPWLEVALAPDADAALAPAFAAAPHPIGNTATIAAEVRPGGFVVLGDTLIGRAAGLDPAAPEPAQLQFGPLRAGGAFAAQVQVGAEQG